MRVRFHAVKVPIFGGFPVENPTKKANRLKALLRGISLSEYGSERFQVRLRRLSEYGSVACLVERPTRETRAEQYSDTVLQQHQPRNPKFAPRTFWGIARFAPDSSLRILLQKDPPPFLRLKGMVLSRRF